MKNKNEIIHELKSILQKTTTTEKHRGYHILPERVNKWIDDPEQKNLHVFYEKERLEYIKSYLDFNNKTVLDIGCNTGYILFDALDNEAKEVVGYEGKKVCTDFVNKAIELLKEKNRFSIFNNYYNFKEDTDFFDIAILLNVLHHIGDDYGDKNLNINKAKKEIIKQINEFSNKTEIMVYQMGFNWQGNIKTCLFDNGLKAEMIEFIKEGVRDYWEIKAIGIPERVNGGIIYKDLNEKNIVRDDSLGEFLNRPLFIFKSKNQKSNGKKN